MIRENNHDNVDISISFQNHGMGMNTSYCVIMGPGHIGIR